MVSQRANRPRTLMQAVRYFNIDTAEAYLASVKWPLQPCCPECGSIEVGQIDEQVFRFNNRKESDWTRFDRLMHMVVGKRLTYADLTGGKTR